jgi:hypothetical protein
LSRSSLGSGPEGIAFLSLSISWEGVQKVSNLKVEEVVVPFLGECNTVDELSILLHFHEFDIL